MDTTYSLTVRRPGEGYRTILDHLNHLGTHQEHVALLANLDEFDCLRRKDDLLDEGVAAVFGMVGAEVELLGLCFHVRRFTAAEAAQWLARRGLAPLIFVSNCG